MKYLLSFMVLTIGCSQFLAGQDQSINKNLQFLTISYFGEKIFHPGISTSYAWYLSRSRDSTNRFPAIYGGITANWYLHPKSHLGVQIKPFVEMNVPIKKTLEIGMITDLGYMRRFYHGPVYTVDENGNVNRSRFAGQNTLVYSIYIIGLKKFAFHKESIFKCFIQIGAFWEYPYNNKTIIHPAVLVGIKRGITL